VRLCLTDQHPVEGIAMQRGQSAQLRNGSFIHSRYPTESSFAPKRLQHVFRQRGVEVIRHGELALGQTDGTEGGDSGSFAVGSNKSY
jgi:hypothetical protein